MACRTTLDRLRRFYWLITRGEDYIAMTSTENTRLRLLTDQIAARHAAVVAKLAASEAGKPSPADMAESEAIFALLESIGKDPSNPLPDPVVTP